MRLPQFRVMLVSLVLAGCAGSPPDKGAVSAARSEPPKLPSTGVRLASGDIDDPILCQEAADSTTRLRRHIYCARESEWQDREEEDREALKKVRRETPLPR